jgi:oligopeptide/dipeptide ABC transporter ATP-binding protein
VTVPLLRVQDLQVHWRVQRRWRSAASIEPVAGVSLQLAAAETLGLVGESGCGKSTLARAIAGLIPITSGRIELEGVDLVSLRGAELRRARRRVQLVFQDPARSLDPRQTVAAVLAESLAVAGRPGGAEREEEAIRLLAEVGLDATLAPCYPHELSGGQRQRVAVARALAVGPRVLIADEPTSALDVPVQARVLNLLRALQQRHGLALLLISHDLHLVRSVCHRLAVMYLGRIVEELPVDPAHEPRHPYSQALATATPSLRAGLAGEELQVPQGEPPSFLTPPTGCPYHPRCPLCEAACLEALPPLLEAAPDHRLRCPVVLR